MADVTSASIHALHQPQPKRALTGAERQRRYKERKRAESVSVPVTDLPVPVTSPAVIKVKNCPFSPARLALRVSALALDMVGISMNAMFARSLGSSDVSQWLFLALGLASDVAAMAIPSCAARLWQAGQRGTAMAGWMILATVFAFALLSGLGFASTSISDVTMLRSSRVTPQVTMAQTALTDAMRSRDAECKGGVGRFCRQREDAVTERRQALDVAMHQVEASWDPQVTAAIRLVRWITAGAVTPTADDFAMVRLALLSLLPQIGGILLMVARRT